MLRGGGGNGRRGSRAESPPGSSSPPSSDSEGGLGRQSRRRRRRSHTLKVTKPIDPAVYSGSADIGKYTTFVREMNEYLVVQNDPVRRDPLHIARFLKGTARQWYEDVVADDDPLDWPFQRFMQALMNACFPTDWKARLRREIDGIVQGELSIRAYSRKLSRSLNLLNEDSEKQKIVRLYNGMNFVTKGDLYKLGYSEEVTSW
ncbi:hypothetical protein CYLTODRAFT_363554, partial [Cylindrobasidium torrendii FP15055 ss-10]